MQSIEHCTGGRTKLDAVWACCTVCNTHTDRSCEAMAEWVTFEADLPNFDSLSSTNCFRFGHCINIGVQRECFPAPVPSGKAIFALQSTEKFFFLQAPNAVYNYNGGRRKVDRKGTSVGRISKLLRFAQPPDSSGSFGEKMDLDAPPFIVHYKR